MDEPALRFVEESAAGVDYLVSRPESGAVGLPLLLGLHGRGSGPEDLRGLCEQLGQRYVHVLPRALHSVAGGSAWYQSDSADRAEQLARSRAGLIALLAELRRSTGTGPEATAVWGFSQGGVLSLELGLAAGSPLAAAVCIGGKLDQDTRESPEARLRARGREFFLVHGVLDPVVPHQQAREAYLWLSGQGARVELAELPMAHEVSPLAAGAVRGYLASVLGQDRTTARA